MSGLTSTCLSTQYITVGLLSAGKSLDDCICLDLLHLCLLHSSGVVSRAIERGSHEGQYRYEHLVTRQPIFDICHTRVTLLHMPQYT